MHDSSSISDVGSEKELKTSGDEIAQNPIAAIGSRVGLASAVTRSGGRHFTATRFCYYFSF